MKKINPALLLIASVCLVFLSSCSDRVKETGNPDPRVRISINDGWKFMKYAPGEADNLVYDIRPEITDRRDDRDADSRPTEAEEVKASAEVLKPWILPAANAFIGDSSMHHKRPEGNPGSNFDFVKPGFDDSGWESVDLPHDWAIKGPFLEGPDAEAGGGMGRLPSHGVAWYRRKINIDEEETGRSIFLDIDGAMSYAMVWINGKLAGGWPYGYNSFRIDLTPYINAGENQLAIRLDNPPVSSRWYPGGGIYRNVWLVKTNPVHVGYNGTFVKTRNISATSATVDIDITIYNNSPADRSVEVRTSVYGMGDEENSAAIVELQAAVIHIPAGRSSVVNSSAEIKNPELWGPPPTQKPHMYKAVTSIIANGDEVDRYITKFGIRSVEFDPAEGIRVNGEHIPVRGVNQHHDLGALGAAFNIRAAERQLEILQDMGCNAIRMAHNPPAPELLELTDRMGFLVIDEIFDVWERKKTPLDFHLIFPEWHEADLRSFIRRDRNNPSVILWSFGNEVGEQYTAEEGAEIGRSLAGIAREEDPTRLTTASMNYAKPGMPFPGIMDVISINYQGEGIRDAPAYSHLTGIRTSPLYPAFHARYPEKVIMSSESASALSSRGTYLFPVYDGISAPVENNSGGDPDKRYVSAYELYTSPFGSSADKVFASLDNNPYVAGEFVWSGWDYLGEPTPYYLSRSSYSGIIDLAGFKKDRFFIYKSRWKPDEPLIHIMPHWNWPGREGEITPVHVFTSGDEAELFLNGRSLGRKKKEKFEYRLRWDSVRYDPGVLKVVAYRDGKKWDQKIVTTTDVPARIAAIADRETISANGSDLSFIEVRITDKDGLLVPAADNEISFSIEGPGEIIATDNGFQGDMVEFSSTKRSAFNGLALVIVRSLKDKPGTIRVTAESGGLKKNVITIRSR